MCRSRFDQKRAGVPAVEKELHVADLIARGVTLCPRPAIYPGRVTTSSGGPIHGSPADPPEDSVLDSLRGAVDPLEARHESDPARPTDLKTQVVRFFLTGVLSAIVDYGLLQLLRVLGLDYGTAKALSFVAGTLRRRLP